MGRTVAEFVLSNYADVHAVEAGQLAPDKVRKVTLQGIVDTGAARLVLPAAAVASLGLTPDGTATVRYADNRTAQRDVVRDAYVTLLGRSAPFRAVLEPSRTDALIGAIVMEDLDLLVDSAGQKLIRRDPNTLVTEIE